MATIFSHAVVGLSLASWFSMRRESVRVLIAGVVCSMVPDVDAIGFRFGIRYGDFWGHRGFTHSILFAALLATMVLLLFFRRTSSPLSRVSIWSYLFQATALHGVLDAMTDGGLGVAFFSPYDTTRYFFAWRPIHVSPISIDRFFSARGLEILQSEVLWIWVPSALLALAAWAFRRPHANE